MKKVPLFCKIRKKFILSTISPSSFYFCSLGFMFRPKILCTKCPLKVNHSLDLSELDKKGD